MAQNLRTEPRVFATGVLTTIEPQLLPEETFSRQPMVELASNQSLDWEPATLPKSRTLFSKAQNVTFTNEVWGLEFTFKPLPMVNVDLPQPDGSFERKLLWYLVYNVKNSGQRIRPIEDESGEFKPGWADPSARQVSAAFRTRRPGSGHGGRKFIRPISIGSFQQRWNDPPPRNAGSGAVEQRQMASEPIVVSTDAEDNSVWGVAIWEDIDPEMDFLSIFVGGLTNAHVWADTLGSSAPATRLAKVDGLPPRRCSSTFGGRVTSSSKAKRKFGTALHPAKQLCTGSRRGLPIRGPSGSISRLGGVFVPPPCDPADYPHRRKAMVELNAKGSRNGT